VFAHEGEALRAHKRNTRARLAEAIAAYEAGQPVVARDLLRELSAASPDDRALASWTARASERVERPDAPDR
jgi:predicted Zn-dependent protease